MQRDQEPDERRSALLRVMFTGSFDMALASLNIN